MLRNLIAVIITRRHYIIDSLLEALVGLKLVLSAIEVTFIVWKKEKQNEICNILLVQQQGRVHI